MRKVSEILRIALDVHKFAHGMNAAGLCFPLGHLHAKNLISDEERDAAKLVITQNLYHSGKKYVYLSELLKAKKKASSLPARMVFWQRVITKLESEGR